MEIINLAERFETWGNLAIAAENASMQAKEGYDCNWCSSGCGGCAGCGGSSVRANYGLKTIEAKAEYDCQGCGSCNGCNGCD